MPIFVYQRTKDGNPLHGWDQWVSFGARPEIFFTKHILSRLREGLITPTAAVADTTDGCASLRSHRKSGRAESSSAGRCSAPF